MQASTIRIPSDYPAIQQGIDAADHGDLVLVAEGTYLENIHFLGKSIAVNSSSGPDVTFIDGGDPPDPDFKSVATF
ncbi:MAG: hypothetical protein KJ645_06860 [Planctomycetes bacterium]|nr:hypothetical protein [Planctomycetota bacterium]